MPLPKAGAAPPAAPAPSRRSTLIGLALAAGGAFLFASKGLFAKALYRDGVDYHTLTTLRALLSVPLFLMLAAGRGGGGRTGRPRGRALLLAAVAGIACYAIGALIDFRALELIDVSIERALLFSYPAIVVAWTALTTRRWPAGSTLAALVMTYGGIVLVVGAFDAEAWRQNLAGSLMVLFCATTTAAYWLLAQRAIPDLGSSGFTIVAMMAAAAAVTAHFLVTRPLALITGLDAGSWLTIGALAVLCLFLPTLMQAEGIRRIGAVRGSLASTIGPPAALLLGAALLGERPGPWQLVGTALIVAGVVLIARESAQRRETT
jgi:drug/metabolite transporter (DMT)-like permease